MILLWISNCHSGAEPFKIFSFDSLIIFGVNSQIDSANVSAKLETIICQLVVPIVVNLKNQNTLPLILVIACISQSLQEIFQEEKILKFSFNLKYEIVLNKTL